MQKNEMKIRELQAEHGSDVPRVFLFRFKDVQVGLMFQIISGKVTVLGSGAPSIVITTDLEVIRMIRRGWIDIPEQDGSFTRRVFNCFDAWRRGEFQIESELPYDGDTGWLSYLLLLDDILKTFKEDSESLLLPKNTCPNSNNGSPRKLS